MSTRQRSRLRSSAADLKPLRTSVAALVAATLFLVSIPPLFAQEDQPSAGLHPADTQPTDPSGGNTFFLEAQPGQSVTGRAQVVNPGDQPLEIKLYLRDLVYGEDGTPTVVQGEQTDVGTWGGFTEPQVTLAPRESRIAEFVVTPPSGAEPGDHIGVVVAESKSPARQIEIIKQNSVRLYVTIPGDARRSFAIGSVKSELDSLLFPSRMTAEAILKNTGRIRLRPTIQIGSKRASGSEILLSRTSEKYSADLRVPWYGGIIRMPVLATADQGLTRRVNHSKFVIPWGMLFLLATAIGLIYLGKKYWWDRRVSRFAAVQADLLRIEALVARRPGMESPGVPQVDDEQEETDAILAGLKRARRTQSSATFERLALALHETSGEALTYLIEALQGAEGVRQDELLDAAASYGPATLADEQGVANLPTDVATELMLRASGTHDPRPNGTKPPAPPIKKVQSGTARKRSSSPSRKKSNPRRKPTKNHRIPPDPRSPK
jgi:hypothetical protein